MTKRRLPRRLRKGVARKWGGTPGKHDMKSKEQTMLRKIMGLMVLILNIQARLSPRSIC